MNRTLPLTFLALLLCTQAGLAAHYKLFVLTGQSNSLGVTDGGESDPSIGIDPADAKVIYFWENVVNATKTLGDSGGVFTTLQETQGDHYLGSATHWGPEIECARTLYRAGMRDFGIVKASRGGGGNTLWSEDAGGHMYSHVVDTVAAAKSALEADKHTFEIVGLLYLQGESDSAAEAGDADTRLEELVTNLREDLPFASNMQCFVGGIAATGGVRDTVREKQADLAASDPTIHYFDNLDQQPRLHDALHFNKAAKITVGERFAGAIMGAGLFTPSYGNLVFIGDSITQGGLGQASFRYSVFKHLVDGSASYTFAGSVTGAFAFQNVSALTSIYKGQSFSNVHEGHFGWRAFWENGRIPLPASRRDNNRGEGTILNWTGQATQEYELDTAGNNVAYPDPGASGTGNIGTTYTPDTVSIMIGINDLAGGTSAASVRDDIGLMIDQLRGSNPSVRIHVCKVLHTDQTTPGLQARVDTLNALLPDLAATKNTASATSPIWIADPSTGFDPVTMAHDDVHPNNAGEIYVGERIAASLGLIEMPPAPVIGGPEPPPIIEKAATSFTSCFEGNEIYNGTNYINGWAEVTPAATTESLVGDLTDLRRQHINGAGAWLEGTNSGWNTANDGSWTIEFRMKINSAPDGVVLWLGTDSNLIFVHIYDDRTTTESNRFNVAHTNNDGSFHVFRIAHDAGNRNYHVWRDGERLTATGGVDYDLSNNETRLIIGDSTSGALGNNYDIVIDSVKYDQTDAYLPTGADADNDGMPDSWEYLYFGDITAVAPGDDADGDGSSNVDEFKADTDPTNRTSKLEIEKIEREGGGALMIHVPDTSPQRLYTLLESIDLGIADPWEAAAATVIGNDATLVLPHTPAVPSSFYRVEVGMP